MSSNTRIVIAPVVFLMFSGCGVKLSDQVDRLGISPKEEAPVERKQAPYQDMRAVMEMKLNQAQAVLEGISTMNFAQITNSAQRLHTLSRRANWQVHKFRTEFLRVTQEMAQHAEEKNLEAVTLDFIQMTMTCVNCHSYSWQQDAQVRIERGASLANGRPRMSARLVPP